MDPQTGLFYRATQPASEPTKQPAHSASAQPPPLSQAEAEQNRHTSTQQTPPPPQLQSKPQISQPSSSSSAFSSTPPLTKKIPKLREQSQPKPQTLTQSPKDRPLSAPTPAGAKVTTPATPTKPMLTPQLPKLQQAPTSHHRPLHAPMSHPPPLQAHHPVSTEKTASNQASRVLHLNSRSKFPALADGQSCFCLEIPVPLHKRCLFMSVDITCRG